MVTNIQNNINLVLRFHLVRTFVPIKVNMGLFTVPNAIETLNLSYRAPQSNTQATS